MIATVLKSGLVTSIISASIAYFLTFFGISFLSTFILATVIQIVVWNIYNNYMQLRNREIDERMLGELAKQAIPIPCAYCKQVNLTPIRFDENNKVNCTQCQKESAVYVNVESSQITTPLELEKTILVNER